MKQGDAKPFDAYYKWLAIPPHEQPPNHYRLLGVECFEEDLDVIAAASDRQMAHIKCFATGKYASHSQRILNELAAARICLLNPDQKARYDLQLKQQSSIGKQSGPDASSPEIRVQTLTPPLYRSIRRNRRRTPAVLLFVIVGGAVGLLAGYGALTLIEQNRADIQTVAAPEQAAKAEARSGRSGLSVRRREPSPRQRTVERQRLDAVAKNEAISSSVVIRPEGQQPPIPNLEERMKRRGHVVFGPDPGEPVEVEDERLPKPSIVVPLALNDATILVIATPVEVDVKHLQCDIGLSQNLLLRSGGGDPSVHEIVAERLGNRSEHTAQFAASIDGCQVGLDISIIHRSSTAVCDIRPRFSLPSGEVQPLTIRDLAKHRERLTTQVSKVRGAKSRLERSKETRARNSQGVPNAPTGMSARGANPAAEAISRSASQSQINMADAAVKRAENRMAEAKKWINRERAINRDQVALASIREYVDRVVADGSIYIRFHAGDVTVPALVK